MLLPKYALHAQINWVTLQTLTLDVGILRNMYQASYNMLWIKRRGAVGVEWGTTDDVMASTSRSLLTSADHTPNSLRLRYIHPSKAFNRAST